MARNNADLAHEIEELIKKYNKKPEKKIKKRDIIELFQQCEVIVAAKVDYRLSDYGWIYWKGIS